MRTRAAFAFAFAVAAAVAVASVSSCAPTRAETVAPVVDTVRRRIGADINATGDDVDARVKGLLDGGLTLESSMQVALLRNPALTAGYASLGVAEADVLRAVVVENPRLSAEVRFDVTGATRPDFVVGLEENITSIVFAAARHEAASFAVEAARARVAGAVVDVAAAARAGYVRAVVARRVARLRAADLAAAQASLDIATRMHDAGNLPDLEHLRIDARAREASVLALDAKRAATRALEEEALTLGVSSKIDVKDALPVDPLQGLALDGADAAAAGHNLALAAARSDVEALAHRLGYADVARFLPSLTAGAAVERRDGRIEAGPSASIALPVVDLGQAETLSLESAVAQQAAQAQALEARVRSRARMLAVDVDTDSRRAQELRALADVRARLVQETQRNYNAMGAGLFDVLDARRTQIAAEIDANRALEDAWLARIELQRLLAGGGP